MHEKQVDGILMRIKRPLLYLVASVILVPTTLAAALLTIPGLILAWANFLERSAVSGLSLFAILAFGSLGIASMWILFFHYRKSTSNPRASRWHGCALLAGAAVSIWLVASTAGDLWSRAFFFGWPLPGAVFFLSLLFRHRKAG